MSNTANDLARDVGLELGITNSVTPLNAEDATDLKRISRFKHAELRVSQICYWDEDDIPDEVYEPLKIYLAACSAKTFGKSVSDKGLDEASTRDSRLEALKTAAKQRYSGKKLVSDFPVARRARFNFTTG